MITGKLYDYLKWLAQILLPAFGTLYVALAALWDLPKPQEVAGTVLAIDFFLGTMLGISQVNFSKASTTGEMLVTETDNKLSYRLAFDNENDLEDLPNKSEVRFRVVKPS